MRAVLLSLLLVPSMAMAMEPSPLDHPPDVESRLKALAVELRCLVCQNQTLADSSAPLAEDLRREIRGMIARGMDDRQIIDFLVARYGDFVLYRPPVKPETALLWAGPFLLLMAGGTALVVVLRRRQQEAGTALSAEERRRAEQLLSNERGGPAS